jgi:hypothetical protein
MNVPADVRAKVLDKVRQIEQDIRNKMPELKDKLNIDYNKVRQENLIKMQTRLKEKELKDIESGKPKVSPPYSEPRAWTQMVGEYDRNFKPLPSPPAFIPNPPGIQEPRARTMMVGEEDRRIPQHNIKRISPPNMTTMAVGEEDGQNVSPEQRFRTMKIGEYDNRLPPHTEPISPLPRPKSHLDEPYQQEWNKTQQEWAQTHPKSRLDEPYNQEWNKTKQEWAQTHPRRSFLPPQ